MSENAALKVLLEANATQLLATIDEVTNQMDNLSAKINSIPSGDKQLGKLAREYTRLSNVQQGLIKSYDKIGTEEPKVTQGLDKIATGSKSARVAVSSLSIAIQDLPFGFIGVQNNLPAIIQSFGNLTTESKNLKGFLKNLGSQLIGPGGLFLAFSAVTAIVTTAVQKYGSLSNAIDALTGNTDKFRLKLEAAKKSYEEFNKNAQDSVTISNEATASVEGQITKVNVLTEAIKSNKVSNDNKKKAIQELKKISDNYFGSLSSKSIDLEKLTRLTNEYTQALINQAIAKGYEDEIVNTAKELAKQQQILIDISNKLPEEYKKIRNAAKEALNVGDAEAYNLAIQAIPIGTKKAIDQVNQSFFKQANVVSDLYKRLDLFKNLFKDITLQTLPLLEFEEPKGDAAKKVKEKVIGVYFPTVAEWEVELRKRLKEFSKLNAKYALDVLDFKGKAAPGIKQVISPEVFANQKKYQEFLKKLLIDTKSTADLISNVFLDPLTNMFNKFVDSGRLAFREFQNIVAQNLKQLVSKIIATGIISLLATIFSGGFSSAAGAASGTTGFAAGLKTFGKIFSQNLGFKNVAAPTFGGVGGGPLAMEGSVNLTLRGSDLIGAINRTNATINRVG